MDTGQYRLEHSRGCAELWTGPGQLFLRIRVLHQAAQSCAFLQPSRIASRSRAREEAEGLFARREPAHPQTQRYGPAGSGTAERRRSDPTLPYSAALYGGLRRQLLTRVRILPHTQIDEILRWNGDEQTETTWIAREGVDHGGHGQRHGRMRQRNSEQDTRRIALAGTDIDAGQSGRPRHRGVLIAKPWPLHSSELFLADGQHSKGGGPQKGKLVGEGH